MNAVDPGLALDALYQEWLIQLSDKCVNTLSEYNQACMVCTSACQSLC